MDGITRRELLLATACWAEILRAQTPASRFQFFDSKSAGEVECLTEGILPGDATPGAREAGVIWFIDGALAGYDKDQRGNYQIGLADTQARRASLFANSTSIVSLTPDQRHKLLEDMEKTDFFTLLRRHTILGFFGHPRHGGNRNGASAKLLGIQESMMYSPPFGYYDGEAAQ
jgi:gluconate 2-dehydrogenase gamma chain